MNKLYSGGKSPPKTPASNSPTRTAATATLAATTHHLVSIFFTPTPLYTAPHRGASRLHRAWCNLPCSTVTSRCPLSANACSIRSDCPTVSEVSRAAPSAVSFPRRSSARSSYFSLLRSAWLGPSSRRADSRTWLSPWRTTRIRPLSVPTTLAATKGRGRGGRAPRTAPAPLSA
jgi:hypothetical protein